MTCVPLHDDSRLTTALAPLLGVSGILAVVGQAPAFAEARNRLLRAAVALGVRSAVVETDGEDPGDRALLAWVRADNATREDADRVAFESVGALCDGHLLAVRDRERHRGPTFVAGSAPDPRPAGDRCAVVACSAGAGRDELCVPAPRLPGQDGAVDAVLRVAPRAAGVIGPEELTAVMTALPDVGYLLADERSGAPEAAWGSRFWFAGEDRTMPFATLVDRDLPGDEASRLDRPGVFRLNLPLGRDGFAERFGFAPRELGTRLGGFDFAASGVWLPHPVYGAQGWCSILNPTARHRDEIETLARAAHERAARRQGRRHAR